ncbi:stemmadenine O-acetyltransferase-like [Cornus florida]|uniref:stemmadenine O-acetyltransferase-like n=1 Tax=Cornus florida TaxID=4283 RepID=UPI0028A0CDD2|nr:stemmadenine O-acetyltransferase-like [Cornus florida]
MAVSHVEVISREMVKPSSPTPHHLRNLKLSFLDQIAPPIYIPVIFFYQAKSGYDIDRAQKSQLLKQSLSDTLTRFYPLAGRIKNDVCIDCNDAGVEYVEAQAHAQLSHVIKNPNVEEVKQYLPIGPFGAISAAGREALLAIQINSFDCGGLAIALCISHKIADGSSLVTFTNAWAATARGAIKNVTPSFDLASHFPPRDFSEFMPTTGIRTEKIVTRRFVFDKMKLAALKKAASSAIGSQVKDPTRVEAVSALIWSHLIDVEKSKVVPQKTFAATHAVSLRTRISPSLPDHAMGNIWGYAHTLLMSKDEIKFADVVNEVRSAIRKFDSDYVKGLQIGDGYLDYLKRTAENFCEREVEFCKFSSWLRFPVYEVDYGWGKPVWVCPTTLPFKNVIILMSTSCGEGIEAWVNMLEDDITRLEFDHKLLSLDVGKTND